ncbi:MAG TPA: DUF488 family protein [Nocardioides sp.]|nr:DUF488 family protein [Nocardioides sp.]
MGQVRTKRAYDAPAAADGYRILVDRLWPRGVSEASAQLDEWLKDVAPSAHLRTWFGHRPERFEEFGERYRAELDGSPALDLLRSQCAEHPVVTLVYAAKDPVHNHAQVLLDLVG